MWLQSSGFAVRVCLQFLGTRTVCSHTAGDALKLPYRTLVTVT